MKLAFLSLSRAPSGRGNLKSAKPSPRRWTGRGAALAIICVPWPNAWAANRNDRALLRELGQNSVQTDVDKFVGDVLGNIDWSKTRNVILDGLRHAEVRHALLLYLRARDVDLKVVYVEISEREREEVELKRGVSLRELATYDRDLTEAQIYDIIPAYADLKVKGGWPQEYAVDTIITRLNLRERPQSAAHA